MACRHITCKLWNYNFPGERVDNILLKNAVAIGLIFQKSCKLLIIKWILKKLLFTLLHNVYLRNNIKTIGNTELIFQDQRGTLNNAMRLIIAQSDFQGHYQWLEKRQFVSEGEGAFWGEGLGSNIKHQGFSVRQRLM